MEKLNTILNKYLVYAIYGFLIMACVTTCNTCNNTDSIKRIKKTVDTLEAHTYTKEQLNARLEIQSLKAEKSTLLNTNQIFLTKERPDRRVIEIDNQLNKLYKETGN